MSGSIDKEKRALFLNLLALGFDVQSEEHKHGCRFDECMFDKPNNRAFSVICHFLFQKLDEKQAQELFKTCFPIADKQSTQEFRKVCYNWLRRISDESKLPFFQKVNSTVFMSPGGREFIHLMFHFSHHVLFTRAGKLDQNRILLPTALSHEKRQQKIQRSAMHSFCQHKFKSFQSEMQKSRNSDVDLQLFSEQQIKQYHSLQQIKRKMHQRRSQILDKEGIRSERKLAEFRKTRHNEMRNKIEMARLMWEKLSTTLKDTNYLREVLNTVIKEKNVNKIDSDHLHVKVPAKLLDECQEEIYQTIGTSLYQGGKINLTSLVSLSNLSLMLIADKIHEDGVPNLEKHSSFLSVQQKLHSGEVEKICGIRKELETSNSFLAQQTIEVISKLQAIYQQQKDSLPQDEVSTDNLQDSLDDESEKRDFPQPQMQSHSHSLGLAQKYLSPAENQDLSFLDEIISPKKTHPSNSELSPTDLDTTSASQAWNISVQDMMPAYKSPIASQHKTSKTPPKPVVVQGTHKRINFDHSLPVARQTATSLTPDTHRKKSFHQKVKGRKSMSLPSSPLPSSGIDKCEEMRKTSAAESKFIEQIVNCTVDANSPESPIVVYQQDTLSQLDQTAFISQDKLQRTPPSFSQKEDSSNSSKLQDRLQALKDQSSFLPIGVSHLKDMSRSDDDKDNDDISSTSAQESSESSPGTPVNESEDSNIDLHNHQSPVKSFSANDFISPCLTPENSCSPDITPSFDMSPDADMECVDSLLNGSDILTLSKSALGFELMDLSDTENSPPTTPHVATSRLVSVGDDLGSTYLKPPGELQSQRYNPIDLLMETPPPFVDPAAARRLRSPKRTVSPLVDIGPNSNAYTNLTPTNERLSVHEVSKNPVPTAELLIDLQTPDVQRTRSLLK
uniref:Uncharacterized protein LOC100185693 n=1 Tax=Phallusia mammillata TaxID=59560 RepID=A0A6F9DIU9_9ASCI|nr:uncharacterized protein LOC100185693 [Phallusia mammillata]